MVAALACARFSQSAVLPGKAGAFCGGELKRKADVRSPKVLRPIRKLLRLGLNAHGYEVLEATNGKTALALLDESPDLVILDLGLPVRRRPRPPADDPRAL